MAILKSRIRLGQEGQPSREVCIGKVKDKALLQYLADLFNNSKSACNADSRQKFGIGVEDATKSQGELILYVGTAGDFRRMFGPLAAKSGGSRRRGFTKPDSEAKATQVKARTFVATM